VIFWVAMAAIAFLLRRRFPGPDSWYGTFKDILPLMVAAPATWVGFVFQQRQSYLRQLRFLWSTLVRAIAGARIYAMNPQTDSDAWRACLKDLSIAIDEIRGVFSNAGESRTEVGLYPFESLKEIYELVRVGSSPPNDTTDLADEIDQKWKRLRAYIFQEFDRECPEDLDSPYVDLQASKR
jgi:hypothetical protein